MANVNINGLTSTSTPAAGSIVYVMLDPSGTSKDKKVQIENLLSQTGVTTTTGNFSALLTASSGVTTSGVTNTGKLMSGESILELSIVSKSLFSQSVSHHNMGTDLVLK